MINKLEDSVRNEEKKGHQKNRSRAKLERLLIKKKSEYKRYINMVREKVSTLRRQIRQENQRKIREIRIERKKEKITNSQKFWRDMQMLKSSMMIWLRSSSRGKHWVK